MKKLYKVTLYPVFIFLYWIIYYFCTNNARIRYMTGKTRGIHCIRYKQDLTGADVEFLPGVEPRREYLTFREFFITYGIIKRKKT